MSDGKKICMIKKCIYLIECKICKQQYIGQTHRILKTRVYEHMTNKNGPVYKHFEDQHPTNNILNIYSFERLHGGIRNYIKPVSIESICTLTNAKI